jgi:NADPH:quinone reductase-like Zn-dependent oxidoreductase
MTGSPDGADGADRPPTSAPPAPPPVTARELVRRRSRTYRAPETGRHHHIGAAPERQPVLGEAGTSYVGTAPVQLAERTVQQLTEQRDRLREAMASAAADLRFEQAAGLRDDHDRVEAELQRRAAAQPGGSVR